MTCISCMTCISYMNYIKKQNLKCSTKIHKNSEKDLLMHRYPVTLATQSTGMILAYHNATKCVEALQTL